MSDSDSQRDRTWLCSVFFTDIVGYSRESVSQQAAWKERFNRHLAAALTDTSEAERVLLDTGDGAAVCFLGAPETAMFAALKFQAGLGAEPAPSALRVRMGINLGPVKLVTDLNGGINALGDGINVAQRVMAFAEANHILVARSYYEAVSCLSDDYPRLFRLEGVRSDKHVREHVVYELRAQPATKETRDESSKVSPETQERIVRILTPLLGPVAAQLVRMAARHAVTEGALAHSLAGYLPTEADRASFLQACGVATEEDQTSPRYSVVTKVAPVAWDPAVLERARQHLAVYLGPMAKLFVQRGIARARSVGELADLLALEISDPLERTKFRDKLR